MQLDLLTSLSQLAITAAETPADGDEIKLDLLTALYVFMLAAFIGFEVIRRISPLLHTPLMSLTNALDAIAVVGAIVLAGSYPSSRMATVLGTIAIIAATSNIVGGFVITDRMLKMFKSSGPKKANIAMIRSEHIIEVLYLVATGLFILSLKWMNTPATARRGVWAGELGMLLAIIGTLFHHKIVDYRWIAAGLVIGSLIGVRLGRVAMTAVPQRTALSHAFGALCVTLVGTAEYYLLAPDVPPFTMSVIAVEVILGSLTFTGSLMAAGKLQEILPQRPITFPKQNYVNLSLLLISIFVAAHLVSFPEKTWLFPVILVIPLIFGVLMIIPIGGADMPTVISLLNSYAGLSAAAMGFVIHNKLLIVAGALDGASGFILSVNMSKAMNRSFSNVLFGAFGQQQIAAAAAAAEAPPVRSASAEEAAGILAAASKVIIVPGYGMAVAQAQYKVRELCDALVKRGVDVKFGIHPVAGRMPGHMNVLLAEADIPYDKLLDMDEINGDFPQTDVALVIGANDVTNPAARNDPSSPIHGMPILDVDKARTVMVIKRGMSPGFAGIDNPLYYLDKTLMLFGDAKSFVGALVNEVTGGHG